MLTCTLARFYGVRITTTEAHHAPFTARRHARRQNLESERQKYPDMVLWKQIDTRPHGGGVLCFTDIRGRGQSEMLLMQEPEAVTFPGQDLFGLLQRSQDFRHTGSSRGAQRGD